MADLTLHRADDLLTELTELVETARALPMSVSCVLPRGHTLDLLDSLRETLPWEMDEARRVVASRDQLLSEAGAAAGETTRVARERADTVLADATRRAGQLVRDAEARASEVLDTAHAERDRLASASGVCQAAERMAADVRAAAARFDTLTRSQADGYAAGVAAEADRYAVRIRGDADDYADHTLGELAATLSRSAATAEQGRVALARRRAERVDRAGPGGAGEPVGPAMSARREASARIAAAST